MALGSEGNAGARRCCCCVVDVHWRTRARRKRRLIAHGDNLILGRCERYLQEQIVYADDSWIYLCCLRRWRFELVWTKSDVSRAQTSCWKWKHRAERVSILPFSLFTEWWCSSWLKNKFCVTWFSAMILSRLLIDKLLTFSNHTVFPSNLELWRCLPAWLEFQRALI